MAFILLLELFYHLFNINFMIINLDYISYEVFDKGFTIFRYYDNNGLLVHKKEYLFYSISEAKKLFIQELKTIFI